MEGSLAVYRLLQRVLQSGEPMIIERKGHRLRIVPEAPPSRLARLTPHPDFIRGDPDDLIHMDWSRG
jgi:hypothetical protein